MNKSILVLVLFFIATSFSFSTEFSPSSVGYQVSIDIPINAKEFIHPSIVRYNNNGIHTLSFEQFQLPIKSINVRFANPIIIDTSGFGTLVQQDTSVQILSSGTLRSYPIEKVTINPVQYSGNGTTLTLYQNVYIELEYKETLDKSIFEDGTSLFKHFATFPFVPKKSTHHFSQVFVPYSNGNAVKILTKSDQLYSLSFKEIFSKNAQFIGKSINSVFLYHKNISIPLNIISTDTILDENDELLFLGKRPIGEEEWVDRRKDQYASHEAFFLTFEPKSNPIRYSELDQNFQAIENQNAVQIEQIIEDYKEYFPGFFFFFSPNDALSLYPSTRTPGEAQYSGLLSTFNPNSPAEYQEFIDFVPSSNPQDSLRITASVIGLNDYHTTSTPQIRIEPNHKATFQSQNDTIVKEYSGQIEQQLHLQLSNSNSFTGRNRFSIQSNIPESLFQFQGVTDWQAVNNIRLKGYIQPFVFNSSFSFIPRPSNNAQNIVINGFNGSEIAVLDSTNGTITKLNGIAGTVVLSSASSKSLQVTVNDKIYSSEESFSITTIRSDNAEENVTFSQDLTQSQITSILNNPSISNVIISGKNSSLLNNELKSLLQIQGENQTFCVEFANQSVKKSISSDRISNLSSFVVNIAGKKYQVNLKVPALSQSKYILTDNISMKSALIEQVDTFSLRSAENNAKYLIISHKDFLQEANELADFHAKEKNVKTKVVDVEQIYNEFFFGKKSPYAIRNFLNYSLNVWQKAPDYVVLFGDASSDPNKYIPKSIKTDFVPTFGRPSSDYWYVFSDSSTFRANFYIGRIPAQSVEEAQNYVSKVKQYSTLTPAQWLKNTQFITGGFNQTEIEVSKRSSSFIGDYISGIEFCGKQESINRELNNNDPIYFKLQADTIIRNINNGVLMNLYLAHGSSDIFQIGGWDVEQLRNFGKYFFLFTGACQTGNFSNSENSCRNETYVVAKDIGSIVSSGITGWGDLQTESGIPEAMVFYILNDADNTWGSAFYNGKKDNFERMFADNIPFDVSISRTMPMTFHSLMQHTFLGDPYISMPLSNKTDYVVTDLKLSNSVLTTSDTVVSINGGIFNKGKNPFIKDNITLIVTTILSDSVLSRDTLKFISQCEMLSFEKILRLPRIIGDYKVQLALETDNSREERINNSDSIAFTVFNLGALAFDPSPYWNVSTSSPLFRFYVPTVDAVEDIECSVYKLNKIDSVSKELLVNTTFKSNSNEFTIENNFVTWLPNLQLKEQQLYEITIDVKRDSEVEALPITIPFFASTTVNKSVEMDLKTNTFQSISTSNNLTKYPTSYRLPFSSIPIKLFSNGKYINEQGNVVRFRQIEINGIKSLQNENARVLSILAMKESDTVTSALFEGDFYSLSNDFTAHERLKIFLDTLPQNTYIFLVVGDENFSGFLNKESTDFRSMDSLRSWLRGYGSSLIDNITEQGTSFAFIGKKGWTPGQAIEKISTGFETITVETVLQIQGKNGLVSLPSFGPLSEILSAKSIIAQRDTQFVKEMFTVFDSRNTNLIPSIMQGDTNSLLTPIDSTKVKPFFTSTISLNSSGLRTNDSVEVQRYSLAFIPFTETSIKSVANSSSVLRGDSLEIVHSIYNHSLRDTNTMYDVTLSVRNENNIEVGFLSRLINNFIPNSMTLVKMTVPTFSFTGNVTATSSIRPIHKREFFEFNNSYSFTIGTFEDTIPPKIEVYMDDKLVKSGSIVGPKPKVAVKISDNSFLPITPSLQRVRINTKIYSEALNSAIQSTTVNGSQLRIEFEADSLPFGESIVQIFGQDGSGNRDTLYFSVFRERNTTITDVNVFPNPVTSDATIRFIYSGSELYAPCTITIYNSLGQIVSTQKERIQLGEHQFPLQLRDNFSNSLPIGTYYFTISLDDIFVLNQPFGTFVIIR